MGIKMPHGVVVMFGRLAEVWAAPTPEHHRPSDRALELAMAWLARWMCPPSRTLIVDIPIGCEHGGPACTAPDTYVYNIGPAMNGPDVQMCGGCGCVRFMLCDAAHGPSKPRWSEWTRIREAP